MAIDKQTLRRNTALVRWCLVTKWDPIGVAEIPEAQDEYDPYVGKVYLMLTDGKSTDGEIAAYLAAIEAHWMGYGAADQARIEAAVQALRELDLRR